ncbi:MAG: VCBS repeat-containing protein [Planctomycetes bacterium]|nr:VCBS repeat-containing protein [Planctomycetota bacterium]
MTATSSFHSAAFAFGCLAACGALFCSDRLPAQQFAETGRLHFPVDEDETLELAAVDIDGDGALDLVAATAPNSFIGTTGQNRLYRNDGHGRFTDITASNLPVDAHYSSAVVGCDVDMDGDVDLVFGNGYLNGPSRQNRLYLNDGTGMFVDGTSGRLPADLDETGAIACGDIDGDGDPDLVIGNFTTGTSGRQNRVYRNDGSGYFTDVTASALPVVFDQTRDLALCDVDADGDLDLVCANGLPGWSVAQQDRLYLNDGSGRFSDVTATHMPVDLEFSGGVACSDVDGDGDPDLVFANGDSAGAQNRVYVNDGSGRFLDETASRLPFVQDATRAVASFDVDGDGDEDLVFGNGYVGEDSANRLLLNDATGVFTDGAGAFTLEMTATSHVVALDVDGDGDADLAVANVPIRSADRLFLNDGTGVLHAGTEPSLPTTRHDVVDIAACDVDGDGDLDLVAANSGESNGIYLNDGRGGFLETSGRMPADTIITDCMAVGDVDNDGDPDLVFGNSGAFDAHTQLYLNDGTGTFVDVSAARLPADIDATRAILLGDVDLDGDLDILIGNHAIPSLGLLGQNRLYINNGAGFFTDETSTRLPVDTDRTASLALCDIDRDGDPDLVVGNNAANRLYENDGVGHFVDVTAGRLQTPAEWTSSIVASDVDLDGDQDLVFATYGGQTRLYVNDGVGNFADETAAAMPAQALGTVGLLAADFDEDGDPDLVLINTGTSSGSVTAASRTRFYRNDGNGHFADDAAALPDDRRSSQRAVAAFDADRDGDLDLVVATGPLGWRPSGWPRLYRNLRRQLTAPDLLRVGFDYHLQATATQVSTTGLVLSAIALTETQLPFPPYGILGIGPAGIAPLPTIVLLPTQSSGSLTMPVPNQTALQGLELFSQSLFATQGRFSNVVRDVVVR